MALGSMKNGSLYGGAAVEPDDMPMGDMDMDMGDSGPYEPKDDEERAYMEAFPDNAWDESRMAALKEGVRLCVEKNASGEYSGGEDMDEKRSGGKGEGLALIFGAPKKKR